MELTDADLEFVAAGKGGFIDPAPGFMYAWRMPDFRNLPGMMRTPRGMVPARG